MKNLEELEEMIKIRSIEFFNWVEENCIRDCKGYFFNDFLVNQYSSNFYNVEELYDFYLEEREAYFKSLE